MIPLRSVPATVLLAVLAVGVVLPTVHWAAHGLERVEERSAHVLAFHQDAAQDVVQEPCPPPPHSVDCAVCAGFWAGADLAAAWDVPPHEPQGAVAAYADWVRTTTATGAGARAPPAS